MDEILFSFSRHNATNALHAQFMTDALAKVTEEVAEAQGFSVPRANFATHANNELSRFKSERAYLDTPQVVETDSNRDDSVQFNRYMAKIYATYCTDAAKRAAGKTISFLFDEAGDIIRLPYAEETSTITQLTKKMRQEPYLSALTTIGMEDAPDEMDSFNDAFNEIYVKRSAENRDRAFAVPMKTLRQNADDAFDELAKAINGLYVVNELTTKDESKREALKQVIDDVNALIVRFRMNMNGSASTGSDKEETPEDPTTGEGTEEPQDPTTGEEGGETTEEGGGETTNPDDEEEGTGAIPHP